MIQTQGFIIVYWKGIDIQNKFIKIRQFIIQTSCQRSAPYTNLHKLTQCCHWLDRKFFSQPEFRNLSTSIKQPIGFIQIQRGSLVLFFLQISIAKSAKFIYNNAITSKRKEIIKLHNVKILITNIHLCIFNCYLCMAFKNIIKK